MAKLTATGAWQSRTMSARARRSAEATDPLLPPGMLEPAGLEVDAVYELNVRPQPKRRRSADDEPPPDSSHLSLTLEDIGPDEHYVIALRHESGAITFHTPNQTVRARRSARSQSTEVESLHFDITLSAASYTRVSSERRGIRDLIKRAVKAIVLKVVDKVVDASLGWVARKWEERSFKKKNIERGLLVVDRDSLANNQYRTAEPSDFGGSNDRCLLLLHGTFSNTTGSFEELAWPESDFFQRMAPRYAGRIFALNHFTVSETPRDNARELLDALPETPHTFDVLTHSRGGLVLRTLAELSHELGPKAERFRLGHGVMVACPNEGTPLATPSRWENTIGLLANVTEIFPPNPYTLTLEFVGEAVTWLAKRIPGVAPGVGSMDGAGELVRALAAPPHSPASYSAVIANYEPSGNLLKRLGDAGLDAFFGGDNDLVVPTAGGALIGRGPGSNIPPNQVGRFGPNGSLPTEPNTNVWHTNIFNQPAAREFIARALLGEPQPQSEALARRRAALEALPEIDRLDRDREATLAVPMSAARAGASTAVTPITPTTTAAALNALGQSFPAATQPMMLQPDGTLRRPPLLLTIMDLKDWATLPNIAQLYSDALEDLEPEDESETPKMIIQASYGNAMVVEEFFTSGSTTGRALYDIIYLHESIIDIVNGRSDGELPSDDQLRLFGEQLFEVLFQGNVRRLYDVARSLDNAGPLDVILTSQSAWVAQKPWEFAYDPTRRTFLATEEVHFTRNVFTAIPAQAPQEKVEPLAILVVSAQPIGAGRLSIDEETSVIRRGFEPLVEQGLAEVDVVATATAGELHERVKRKAYDVVHFIGHGIFDEEKERGYLVFEDSQGREQKLDEQNMREILCGRSIRLVFLNACESGRGARADFNRGVAPALVAGGMPTVVANQYSVLDVSATAFAQSLYQSLAQGHTIGEAAREARIAVNYSISGESIDWAVPVVYTRDPQDYLAARRADDPAASATAIRITGERKSQRRAAERVHDSDVTRVGVWDVNNSHPHIGQLLHQLNARQQSFVFELTNVSAPLGSWRKAPGKDGERRLHVVDVAQRLRNVPGELGVDYLLCLTTDLMQSDTHPDLHRWWSAGAAENADSTELNGPDNLIFMSTAGLAVDSHSDAFSRFFASQTATMLLGVKANLDAPTNDVGPANAGQPQRLLNSVRPSTTFERQAKSVLPQSEFEAAMALYEVFKEAD